MALKFTRRADTVLRDWNLDPTVVKARERLAQLEHDIPRAADRIKNELAQKVEEAEKRLHRVEMEVLASRASDSELAAAQDKALQAKIQHAQAVIAVEDMQAERKELAESKLPALEHKARVAAHTAMQAKAIALLKEMQASLQTVCQLEAELSLLQNEASKQFPRNINQEKLRHETEPNRYEMVPNPGYDPDCVPAAGVPSFAYVGFDRVAHMQFVTTISSRNATTLAGIEQALKQLEGESDGGK